MTASRPLAPISDVASALGVSRSNLVLYGDDKAKVRLAARGHARDSGRAPGRLVLVTALTPTTAGEGKTTTSIGLAQGMAKIGQQVCLALREPSLGPTFGMKGGATGGGLASVVPLVDINLHFTGDFHAISTANNHLAAMLDNHLQHGNKLGIDPRRILWRRVVDLNDRALRNTLIGLGGPLQGVPRETGFDITPASEIMAALCLSEDVEDLRRRLGRILVALTHDRQPVTVDDLKVVGSLMVLLKDAVNPNLVQTLEGVPAFIHGGPFGNIAHGCNSVIATKMAMAHADWTVTEAGFGFDLGGEKFMDIKCVGAGLSPAAVVLVATIRALKRHGGVGKKGYTQPNPAAVEAGLANLRKHAENIQQFGKKPIIALNRFAGDPDDEVDIVRRAAAEMGLAFAVCDGFARGGDGATELAEQVVANAEAEATPIRPVYDWSEPIPTKMEKLARNIYGASGVAWTSAAEKDLKLIRRLGYEGLPLCVAKTQMSFSDDPKAVGRPEGFETTVRGLLISAGAGFVVPLTGDIMRMPGLPKVPQAEHMDLVDGEVVGMA
ncbi:MAG: formate--tetrahydrofolate ligase [Deltaproteobacteria bacterium]|nr:formate--tetrahydrofolate ligase [Deltaproteobacteria bacterium]